MKQVLLLLVVTAGAASGLWHLYRAYTDRELMTSLVHEDYPERVTPRKKPFLFWLEVILSIAVVVACFGFVWGLLTGPYFK